MSLQEERLAQVQLVGALAYGQLRAWSAAAAAVPLAPDVRSSEELARLTAGAHDVWLALRAHLETLTDLPEAVLERQREAFDDFFTDTASSDWEHACTVLAFGWPIAHDFAQLLAEHLEGETGDLLATLAASDDGVAAFALAQLEAEDADDVESIRASAAEVVGAALVNYQRAVGDSDALDVLLESSGPDTVRRLAIEVWNRHRRRLAALGIDDPA
jgi:hypothetical protein